jgi:hypothetical protein
MYIQDKVEEYSDEVFDRMEKGAHLYFCGLKGMMPGILAMMEGVCVKKGRYLQKFRYKCIHIHLHTLVTKMSPIVQKIFIFILILCLRGAFTGMYVSIILQCRRYISNYLFT